MTHLYDWLTILCAIACALVCMVAAFCTVDAIVVWLDRWRYWRNRDERGLLKWRK